MTDKIQRIRNEIKRLKDQYMSYADDFHSLGMEDKRDHYAVLASVMEAILNFIDTMQEEPYGPNLAEKATKTPEKAFKQRESNSGPKNKCKGCNNVKGCVTCVDGSEWAHYEEPKIPPVFDEGYWERLGEEPVSEDLKSEVQRWVEHYIQVKESGFQIGLRDIQAVAEHFANWQKEKDAEIIFNAKEEGYRLGKATMKQQMMKDAVDGEVGECYPTTIHLDKDISELKHFDKVKLIIIMEE